MLPNLRHRRVDAENTFAELAPLQNDGPAGCITLVVAGCCCLRGLRLRIVLSNIGTFGDINPLVAVALELKRRGHTPVMAIPEV